ncbi:hypothetical protein HAX54_003513 [Datura stramonium]|uniref:Uncharacterized protein n=1 Tax=Datura stramonium TaxID=4076 RepID=A0ABS8RVQ3_DATST|nr:hypothetical protein [Datura stramonium]
MENNSHQPAVNAASEATTAHSAGYPTQLPYDHLLEQQQHQLQMFWSYQHQKINQMNDFKNYEFPLARIRKIMKSNRDVHMVSAETPILFSRLQVMFRTLTHRWVTLPCGDDGKDCCLSINLHPASTVAAARLASTPTFVFFSSLLPEKIARPVTPPCQNAMENNSHQPAVNAASEATTAHSAGYPTQLPYDHLLEQQQHQLQMFWSYQHQKINQMNEFQELQFPLAASERS